MRYALAAIAAFALLTACGSDVPWEDYDPGLKGRITTARDAKDCPGLQTMFDAADKNNEATMARAGHNNADLMSYIDDALKAAGCHG